MTGVGWGRRHQHQCAAGQKDRFALSSASAILSPAPRPGAAEERSAGGGDGGRVDDCWARTPTGWKKMKEDRSAIDRFLWGIVGC